MMRRANVWTTTAAVIGVLAWVGAFGAFAAAMKAKPTAVAVVQVENVFQQIKERNEIEADLRARNQNLKKQEKQRRQKIAEMKNALDITVPGSDNHEAKQSDLEKAVLNLRVWTKYQQQKMNDARADQIQKLYAKMRKTVGKVAKERGYDLVLFKEKTPDFQKVNPKRMSAALQNRKVLWSTDKVDLTDEIVTRMNNQYDASR